MSLAHSAEYGLNDSETEILIKNLMDYGLEAIEVLGMGEENMMIPDSILANLF